MTGEHVFSVALGVLGAVLLAVVGSYHHQAIVALENGYCEVQNVGSTGSLWQKCK